MMALGITSERSAPKVLSGIWFWARAEPKNVVKNVVKNIGKNAGKKIPHQDNAIVLKLAQGALEPLLEQSLERFLEGLDSFQ
jgi:hypothetical protein